MRKLFLVILLVVILQFGAFAQTNDFQMGIKLANSGDFQTALVHFQKSATKNLSEQKLAQIHYNIGVCFYRLNQLNKAITEFEKAVKFNPNYEPTFYAMGMAEVDLGNFERAENAFLKAIRLNEKNGETWFDLAIAFYKQKKFDESIVAFQNAIKYKSVAKSVSYNNLGVVYALQGDLRSATKQMNIAVKLNVPEAKNNLEILRNISITNNAKLIAKLILMENKK